MQPANPSRSLSVSRRDALKTFGASTIALAASFLPARLRASEAGAPAEMTRVTAAPAPEGPYVLPPLGYAYEALEPGIDAATMTIHHRRHHQAYINAANRALEGYPDLQRLSVEELLGGFNRVPGAIRTAIRNNAGGHANHTLFWDILTPGGPKMPEGMLARRIESDLEGFTKLIERLSQAALTLFGSGWAWLTLYRGKLSVYSTANQDSPLMDGATPLLGIDVWEHAYYLSYQNRRSDYLKAVLGLINWNRVNARLEAALKKPS